MNGTIQELNIIHDARGQALAIRQRIYERLFKLETTGSASTTEVEAAELDVLEAQIALSEAQIAIIKEQGS